MEIVYLMKVTYPSSNDINMKFVNKGYLEEVHEEYKKYYTVLGTYPVSEPIKKYFESLKNNFERAAKIDDEGTRHAILVNHFEVELKALKSINYKPIEWKIDMLEKHVEKLKN